MPRLSLKLVHTHGGLYSTVTQRFLVQVQATRKGETGLVVPPVTGKLPPVSVMKARQQPQYSTSQGYVLCVF